ncbi:hypothetical protein [Nioella sp.]|uniref:hypothetical protein n=1 Tax=Nioella sp. TaxID=1912091 RepID=UPI003B5203DB
MSESYAGITMEQVSKAKTRFSELIKKAQISRSEYNSDPGSLTRADYDELALLARFLSSHFPPEVHTLLSKGYSEAQGAQRDLGQRIERIISVYEDYSIPPNMGELSGELLPTFSLEARDKGRALELCGDLRKIVLASPEFDDPHKKRLLNRIAAMEQQIHSPKGLFDVILGGISDFGEVAGKFGKDIKPMTDRLTEIAGIARRGSQQYNQIPAPEEVKKLPPPSDDNSEE